MKIGRDPTTGAAGCGPCALQLSVSEIAALSWGAIRGSGRTWAEAEEGAQATCWLARAGLDWASALAGLLDMPAGAEDCPLRAGMRLADFAGLPEGAAHRPVGLPGLRHPIWLLPFAAQAAAQQRQWLGVAWTGLRAVLGPGLAPALTGTPGTAGPVTVRLWPVAPDPDGPRDWPSAHRGAVGAEAHAALAALALRVTVPSSATSLSGAWGQGDDND